MLLPVLVLLTGVALLLLVLASDARSEREKAYTMAAMNAVSYEVMPTGGWRSKAWGDATGSAATSSVFC